MGMRSIFCFLSIGVTIFGYPLCVNALENSESGTGNVAFENSTAGEKGGLQPSNDILATDVLGTWVVQDSKSLIEIARCEESVCGTLEWFPELETITTPILDSNNPDDALKTRELKGIKIIYDFKETSKGWRKGRIYDPETGKTYKSKLTRIDSQSLRVEGCIGPICQKFIWVKAKTD